MAARRTRPASRKRPKGTGKAKPARSAKKATAPKRAREPAGAKAAPPASKAPAARRVAAARAVAVGRVVHYFAAAGAAEIALEAPIRCGDVLHVRGHTTDLLQAVESLRRAGARIQKAGASESVTLAVVERVRRGDQVYRLEFPEPHEGAEPPV